MKDVNKITLVGRVGAEPVLRETKGGIVVAHFPLATSRWIKEPQKEVVVAEAEKANERTQWHRVVVWGKQAEICGQYLKKGDSVYVEGPVLSHRYETKDGEARIAFEVHADTVSFLGGRSSRSASGAETGTEPVQMAVSG